MILGLSHSAFPGACDPLPTWEAALGTPGFPGGCSYIASGIIGPLSVEVCL